MAWVIAQTRLAMHAVCNFKQVVLSRGTLRMRNLILACAVLFAVTMGVYWQTGSHEFINLDDNWLITGNVHVNTGLTKDNLLWALAPVPDMGWFPVAWLSHMADVELYGLNPRGHHLTSVVFHAVSTVLLFLLLFRLTNARWPSLLVAALFALHPLHVESVAWVAERRDVLSAFWGFLALLFYAEYAEKRRRKEYLLALVCFALGLLSKPMLATLPAVMLLMDYWPLNRFDISRKGSPRQRHAGRSSVLIPLVKEKIPFALCSLVSAAIAAGVMPVTPKQTLAAIPLGERAANAVTACVKYILQAFWPVDLAIFYPFPVTIPLWQVVGSLLVLLGISAAVIRLGRHHPYLVVGWFWYLITITPVLGLIQFGPHAMADRYTYLPLVGLFIAVAWGVPALLKNCRWQRYILIPLAVTTMTGLTALTWQQLGHWQNSISLFQHALSVTEGNLVAYNNLGLAFSKNGQIDQAIIEYRKGIEAAGEYLGKHIYPEAAMETGGGNNQLTEKNIRYYDLMRLYNNLGVAYIRKKLYDEAIVELNKSVDVFSFYGDAYYNLGLAYEKKGAIDMAVSQYTRALDVDKNDVSSRNALRRVLERQR